MSRDRLNDYNNNDATYHPYPASTVYNNQKQTPVELAPLRGDSLSQFFQETEVISGKIQLFQSSISEIDQLFGRSINSRLDPESSRLLEEKTKSTNSLSKEIFDRLQALTDSNRKVRTRDEFESRKMRTSTLSKQFKQEMSRFQSVQYQNSQKSKDTVARQYRIANPEATEQDIRRLVDEDQGGIYSQQLMQQARGQQAAAALSSVQGRQRELHQLQQNIVELAQLFSQLEHLISEQDLVFHEIESSVQRAESDIEKGHGEVGVALGYGIAARKKKWIMLGILLLVIIIIVLLGVIQGWFTPKA